MTDADLGKPVVVLRALLTRDFDTYRSLNASLGQSGNTAYAAVLGTAFMEAVDRHFGENPSPGGVINFVAEVRARYATTGQMVSAQDAENVIRAALGEDHLINAMDGKTAGAAQTAMLFALVQEDGPSPAAVDALLASASEQAAAYFRRNG